MRPVLGSRGQTLTMLALLVQPGLLIVSAAGHADHHTLQVLLLVVGIGLTLRALERPKDRRWAYAAGAVAAGGIWVGAEQVIAATLMLVALAWPWLRHGATWLDTNRRFAVGLAGGLAFPLVVERPPDDWVTSQYDRLSIAHLAFGVPRCCSGC